MRVWSQVLISPRDHGPLYFTSWARHPPALGEPRAEGRPGFLPGAQQRPPRTAAGGGPLHHPTPRPSGAAAGPPRGPGAQGGRCKGAGAGEAKRIGPDRRAAGVGTGLPPVSALPSRAHPPPRSRGTPRSRGRRVRDWCAAPWSRFAAGPGRRAERPLGSGSGARFTSVLPPPELGEGRRGSVEK